MKFTEPDFQVLATRLDKLESQNRRWKLAAILLAVSTSALVQMAAKRADQVDSTTIRAHFVEAQEFILKDPDGQVFARLTLSPSKRVDGRMLLNYGPALQFYNENGKPIWTAPQEPLMVPAR
jgi:hypothetical protein